MATSDDGKPDMRLVRGERTKAAILKAARRLFSEKGFRGTSVKDITDAAGIPKSLFYHYFKSMDGLLADIIDASELLLSAEEREGLRSPNNDPVAKDGYVDRIFSTMREDRESLMIIFSEALRSESVLGSMLKGLALISGDLDRLMPEELRKGYQEKDLVVLRLYTRFFPLIMLSLTEDEVARYFGMKPEELRSLVFSAMRDPPPSRDSDAKSEGMS